MNGSPDEYQLEDITRGHCINAGLFMPFVIERLRTVSTDTDAVLTVTLRDIGLSGERQRRLRIRWLAASIPALLPGVQEHTVTEWAALGIACVVVAQYATLQIQSVTALGDRFDYWVSDGERECGLEVSGTRTGDRAARQRSKVQQ